MDQVIITSRDEQTKRERQEWQLKERKERLLRDRQSLTQQHDHVKDTLVQQEKSLKNLEHTSTQSQQQLTSYAAELNADFQQTLTQQEVVRLDAVSIQVSQLETELNRVSLERVKVTHERMCNTS